MSHGYGIKEMVSSPMLGVKFQTLFRAKVVVRLSSLSTEDITSARVDVKKTGDTTTEVVKK